MSADTRRRRAGATVLALAVLASSACGVGDRQARAERIARGRELFVAGGPVGATIRYSSKHKPGAPTAGAGFAAGAAAGVNAPASLAASVGFDFGGAGGTGRAAVVVEPPDPTAPIPGAPADGGVARVEGPDVLFDGQRVFVQRETRRPAERRAWASLDLERLPDDERAPQQSEFRSSERLEVFAKTINPIYLVDLSLGTLAGSVERVGEVTLDGAPATHYRANVSLEKASTEADLSDDEVATRKLAFRLGGVIHDVNPVDYWMSPDGHLLRARFRFEQRHFPRIHDIVTVDLRLSPVGQDPAAVAPGEEPPAEVVINVNNYSRYVRQAVARSSGA